MTVSIVIPSARRRAQLCRCLDSIRCQVAPGDEILVAIRRDDPDTRAALRTYETEEFSLRVVEVDTDNASDARNRCLDIATGDILVFTDDDTEPRSGWIAAIKRKFAANPTLGGLGGPDWYGGTEVPPAMRPSVVGVIQWWGRQVGNHHRGARDVLAVEWLKGANMSFRREALASRRFGSNLVGRGAQFAEDMALSLQVSGAGWKLEYDPMISVDHHPGPLVTGVDHRKLGDTASLRAAAHNETIALLTYLPPLRRLVFMIWSLTLGIRLLPGPLMAVILFALTGDAQVFGRSVTTLQGRLEGWHAWRARSTSPGRVR